MITMKLNGGTLFYTLAISIVIAMLTCSILLAEHFTRLSLIRDIITEEVIRNAESGIALACIAEDGEYSQGKEVDLFGREKDSVFVKRKPWGAFDLCISYAHTRKVSFERVALIGCMEEPEQAFALWLADMDRPLSITGSTELRGKCFLPKSGVERAYIEGNSYQGKRLVFGETENSSRILHPYNEKRVKQIEELYHRVPSENDSIVAWSDLQLLDSSTCSFKGKTLIVSETQPIRITNQIITGQICIVSSVSIFVSSASNLESVILVAPRIEIEAKTQGQFQAFASDSLIVGKSVKLYYPTILALCAGKLAPDFAGMVIREGAKIMGDVFASTSGDDFQKHVTISIEKNAVVYGSVYSTELVDLKATVIGSVTCAKFVLKTNSAVYENHLMNAVIDRTKRNEAYVGSLLSNSESGIKSVVQWLE